MARALDYEQMQSRASRAFAHEEWASAGALYSMMIVQRPAETSVYGHAIVAAGMLSDSTSQSRLTAMALDALIPIDSLFRAVETTSFSICQTSLYEKYLLDVRSQQPWLSRIADGYLLRYYAYRRDGAGMVEYSRKMLEGAPMHIPFLYTLAQGYLLLGHTDEALHTYNMITELDADSVEALLYLANYYYGYRRSDAAAAATARQLFGRVQALAPTPYIAARLRELQ